MAVTNQIKPIPLTFINSADIIDTYLPINSGGLPFGCCIINIQNNTTEDITVSYDGLFHHEYIPTLMSRKLYFQTNAQPNTRIAILPAGTVVYVKGTAGIGGVYLSGWYQPQAN